MSSQRAATEESSETRLRRLFGDYHDFVWRVLRRLGLDETEADDCVQEVFLVALGKLPLIHKESERSFLYGTALRLSRNLIRKRHKLAQRTTLFDDKHASDVSAPDRAAELSQARRELDSILRAMPEAVARIVILAELEQLGVPEIAALEGIPEGTVSSRLRKGRELLRQHLKRRKARDEHPILREPDDRTHERGDP